MATSRQLRRAAPHTPPRPVRRPRPPRPPRPRANPSGYLHCMDVTDETFEREVVPRPRSSRWSSIRADWCGPWKMLAPFFERRVASGRARSGCEAGRRRKSRRRLTLRNPQHPGREGVSGGHVVAEFLGAQRPTAVSAFLDQLTGPSAAEQLLSELGPRRTAGDRRGRARRRPRKGLRGDSRGSPPPTGTRAAHQLRELAVALFQELARSTRSACIPRRLATALTANEPPFRSAAARR